MKCLPEGGLDFPSGYYHWEVICVYCLFIMYTFSWRSTISRASYWHGNKARMAYAMAYVPQLVQTPTGNIFVSCFLYECLMVPGSLLCVSWRPFSHVGVSKACWRRVWTVIHRLPRYWLATSGGISRGHCLYESNKGSEEVLAHMHGNVCALKEKVSGPPVRPPYVEFELNGQQ